MSFPTYPGYKDSGVPWLGAVPSHWEVMPLKRLFATVGQRAQGRSFPVALENIESCTGRLLAADGEFEGEGVAFQTGDILYGKLRPYLAKTWVANCAGEAVGDFHVLRAVRDLEPNFYRNLLLSPPVVSMLNGSTYGAKMPRVSWDFMGMIAVARPPAEEQRRIAAFLDEECAKISDLIAEQERLIALLQEKRRAVISQAVTRGLTHDVPMKDSGVGWMGAVPVHWRVLALRHVTHSRCDGPFGSGLKSEHYSDAGARVVRLQNIRDGRFDDTDSAFLDISYFESALTKHEVVADDVLIAGLGDDRNLVGRACVAPRGLGPAMVKADCFRFRLDRAAADPHFVAFQLSVGAAFDAGRLASGSTRSRISLSEMASRLVALPSVSEQAAIVERVKKSIADTESAVADAGAAIVLLKERRAALISAAVTGKIDVRGLVPLEEAA